MNADQRLLKNAMNLANLFHNGQVRKYSNLPYVVHPVEVAMLVHSFSDDPEVIAAAMLHDVFEDGPGNGWELDILKERVQVHCGDNVFMMVDDLTDKFTKEAFPEHNRKQRKMLEAQRLGNVRNDSKTVKLADVLCNRDSIVDNDPVFGEVYLSEMRVLVPCLSGGDASLWDRAFEMAWEVES